MKSSMHQMNRRTRDVMHLERARYLEQSFIVMRDELEKSMAAQQISLRLANEMMAEMRQWREYLEYQSRNPVRVTFALDPVTPRPEEPNMNHQMGRQYSDQQAQHYVDPGQDFRNESPMISRQMNGSYWFADQFNFRDREPR
ncbi:hypothetical protein RvY_07058-2 [Ramazzottius varieornatus]|uniref:Uncharacterized protein n=1 Tax=Ramazzottius varieornatus TaxID=947166 RepID=A0A1D1V3H5_RAMVA|nr:hypothetical protein RvY_07058-2 [Ramazzottius varieornatus]